MNSVIIMARRRLAKTANPNLREMKDGEYPEFVTVPKGTFCKIAAAELVDLFAREGAECPKFVAHAVSRWTVWKPLFRPSLAGVDVRIYANEDMKISCGKDWEIYDDGSEATVPKVEIKTEVKKVDEDFFEFPKESEIIERAMLAGKNVFLSGPTGCGKTELFVRLLEKNSHGYSRMNMDGDLTKSDFVGDWVLTSQEGTPSMAFREGILPTCMREGKALLLDELDAAPQEVLFVVQSVLEGKPLTNTKTNERLVAKPGFQILATANTVGKGDMSTLYAGTRLLNEATLDRFHYILRLGYPSVDAEARILVQRTGISVPWAKQIARLAEAIRRAGSDGSIYASFSVRKTVNLASALVDGIPVEFALRATILDRLSEEDAVKVSEQAQRILDKTFPVRS